MSGQSRSLAGLIAAAAMLASDGGQSRVPSSGSGRRNRTNWIQKTGIREKARRRRQIERGQLKAENGLVSNNEG